MARELASNDSKVIFTLTAIFVSSVALLVVYVANLQQEIISTTALESAKRYSSVLAEFRTVYTSEVINRIAVHSEIKITHDYANTDSAIPLPATLSMILGDRIGSDLDGAETHLYSAYPFPWRQNTGGLIDPFRIDAWQALTKNPDRPHYVFTQYKGRPVLRYATADLMRESCVQCHNTHPDTPKTGWKTGDVRGVLEIIHPMQATLEQTAAGKRDMFILTAIVTIFGIVCLVTLVKKFKATTVELERRVDARTQEIRHIEKQLTKSKKMAAIGEISSGMAHEVNQPLGAIKLTISILKSALDQSDQKKALLQTDRIDKQVDRIDKIITQLNTFQHGSHTSRFRPTVVSDIINNAVEQVTAHHTNTDIVVSVDHPNSIQPVYANIIDMERVLINLLTNAIYAVENNINKRIEIRAHDTGDKVILSVSDNGPGIPRDIIDKLFDPFFTTKPVGKGTGLNAHQNGPTSAH
jgi:Histidine kinase-, DNA gyrase B-, and HSP90-like ATPase/Protein of unknown function (DUF3365)/His Kinase A (phospho-acceptor) domain